jgi:biopolymer transport protein TolR
MRYMGRAARMERHHKRHRLGGLNLVSLMDIFTILVFFLLVNSSEVEVLPNAKEVQLPESIADQRARETVVVLVTPEHLLVQGRVIGDVAEIMASREIIIPALKSELTRQAERGLRQKTREDVESREVTIMGDKEIPYQLLKKVMATCTEADYGRLSLAVLQKSPGEEMASLGSVGG